MGAITEFGGIQKKAERGEWLILTPVRVDMPAKKEEGCRKYYGHGMGARPSGGGGGRDTVFNQGVDPKLRIMERIGDMTAAARSENLRIALLADGR